MIGRKQPVVLPPDPAVLGWVIADADGRLTRAGYHKDRSDAERELAQWRKQMGGRQWQLVEVRSVA